MSTKKKHWKWKWNGPMTLFLVFSISLSPFVSLYFCVLLVYYYRFFHWFLLWICIFLIGTRFNNFIQFKSTHIICGNFLFFYFSFRGFAFIMVIFLSLFIFGFICCLPACCSYLLLFSIMLFTVSFLLFIISISFIFFMYFSWRLFIFIFFLFFFFRFFIWF